MSEWFRKAFGEEYLNLYKHRDAAEAEQVVDLIVRCTGVEPGGVVIDGPCGAGRHLQAFQKRGFAAFGFDLSMPLLTEAVNVGLGEGTVVRADLRAMPFKRGGADLVVNLFSSLGYFNTDEQNLMVLNNLVELCKPGGWVVVDFMHSKFVKANLQESSERLGDGGIKVLDRRWIAGEPERVNKATTLVHPDGREDVLEESVRLFSPGDLREALGRSRVTIEQELGGYDGAVFCEDSPRVILVGRRQ